MEAFEAYQTHLAIKAHFNNPSYDFKKYNGKVRAKFTAFAKSKGKYFYNKLGKKYKKDLPEFLATTVAYLGDVGWIGDFDSEDSIKVWEEHQKYIQSIKHTFSKDIDIILNISHQNDFTFNEMFLCKNKDDLPPIGKLQKINLITLETCVILNRLSRYTTKIKCTNPLWGTLITTIEKYDTFLILHDNSVFITILKSKLQNKKR